MKITTWNIRGLNAPNKKRLLKQNLNKFESDIIILQETKLNKLEGLNLGKRLGNWSCYMHESVGASGGLGVIWNHRNIILNILSSHNNWICMSVNSIKSNLQLILFNIYGPISTFDKFTVWNDISSYMTNFDNIPIILGGDFNTILNLNEKTGGSLRFSQPMKDFNNWYHGQKLVDIPCCNGVYTWNNRRKDFAYIAEKLDRFFIKGNLEINNCNIQAQIMPFAGSDHFPVRLELSEPRKPMRSAFKCEKMWFLDPSFLENIKIWWSQGEFEGSKMFVFVCKMKMLKESILKWNKVQFKNIFKEKLDIEDRLRDLNLHIIKYGMNNDSYMLEKELLAKQEDILSKEEVFWKQKSRERWLEEGDRNTKYFHNSTLFNRARNTIKRIRSMDGSVKDTPSEIADTLVSHFQLLLNNLEGSNKFEQDIMLKFIPKLVSPEDNKVLNQPISFEEVRNVIFDMNPEKSPGPDGFQVFFYQKCWDILGNDLWEALEASRKGGSLLSEINHSFITLIPKKAEPKSPNDFRPIALCNTIYKIYSKILANRIKHILPKIISEEQTGFVPGRSILDGIIIIQEAIHSALKNNEACMFMKLDIQKAYDMVDWRFLCKTLEAFGFSRQWVNLIFKCISTTRISVLVNGSPEGFFEVSRGLRQGDPLSPFLFIIMAEAFGRAISNASRNKEIRGVTVTQNVPNITHQQYADDTILPGESSWKEALNYKSIIDNYMNASGQKVNVAKSEIFFLNTEEKLENQICSIMGYKKGSFPCKYLGIDLEKCSKSSKVWHNTLNKLEAKIGNWKDKWLTKAGKSVKIRSVLSAVPTYPLSCLPLSKNLLHKFEAKLRDFLWNDCEESKKLALVKWDKICKPKELGGLGIKNLAWQNAALGAKLVWRLYNERDQKWAKIMYNKYLDIQDPTSIFRMKSLPRGSESWNFMSKCRHLVSKFLTWDVGNGKKALFWDDSWDGRPPIANGPIPAGLKHKLCSLWGKRVIDYKTTTISGNKTIWRWKSGDGINLSPEELLAFNEIISSRTIKQSEREDKLIWAASNDGNYRVKVGYKALLNSKEWERVELPLSLCWDPSCLPKAGFFLWLAAQNRILTADRLNTIGISGPSRCFLCKSDFEDAEHLLFNCPYSRKCWEWLIRSLGWSAPFPGKFKDFILGWPTDICKGVYNKIWYISPSVLLWEIWKERNRRIFCNIEMDCGELISKIEASIVEIVNSYLRKSRMAEGSFSDWDCCIKKLWPKLINPPMLYPKASQEARRNCKWSPPPRGWAKLNFDGAARGNPGMAGIGCIVNNDSGVWIAKKAKPIGPSSNNMAEFLALEEGLNICLQLGISKLIIEGDSQIILNAIRKRSTPNWILNSRLQEVILLLDKFEELKICHIFREGNSEADVLANFGADGCFLSLVRS